MKALYSILFLIVLFGNHSNANPFRYLQPDDGLSSGEINHITQDQEGRIWLATWTGLVCYDGYEYTNFRPVLGDQNSLPDKKIKKLFVDSNDQLWIATEMSIARMDLKTLKVETFDFDRSSNQPINILYISEISKLIIVHSVEGIYQIPVNVQHRFEKKFRKIELYNKLEPINQYLHITKNISDETLIAASNTGTDNTSLIYFIEIQYRSNDTILSVDHTANLHGDVYDITFNSGASAIYFATSNGIYLYDNTTSTFAPDVIFRGINTQHIIKAGNHKIYVSDNNPGLYYYDTKSGESGKYTTNPNKPGSILNSNILCLFEDFSGNLWIGHQGQGISLLDLTRKEFHTIRRNPASERTLTSNTVMCFESNQQYLLVGCRTGGINITELENLEKEEVEFEVIPLDDQGASVSSNDGIWDICRQNDSVFWIGHSKGIHRLEKRKTGWDLQAYRLQPSLNDYIRSVFIDKFHNLWCGTLKNGLLFIPNPDNNPNHKYYKYTADLNDSSSLSDNVIIDIFLDSQERFWIGTNNGLNLLTGKLYNFDLLGDIKPTLSFEQFVGKKQTSNFLNNNEINCILENTDGKIWIATQGGGINIFDPETKYFSHFTTRDGLPGNDIFSILPDDRNNLWISTERGLAAYNQNSTQPKVTVYRSNDGIQSNVFLINSYHRSVDGRLFFGGENGFTTFNPDQILPNNIPPKIVLTELKVLDKTINVGDTIYKNKLLQRTINETAELTLPFHKNTFTIGVAAIHFQNPSGNKIAYLLEGYQTQWQEMAATKKSIVFTKLPAGKYTLKVNAISSDNNQSKQLKTIEITILAPWYLTKIMIVIYLILSLSLITLIIVTLINRQKQLYLQRVYNLTIENNESKMTYLANMAHELRTPLSLIISPIEDMIINKNEVRKKWHNHIHLVHRNSNYILKLINQIIDFRKLDAGKLTLVKHNTNLNQLITEVAYNFKAFENKQNIELIQKLPSNSLIVNIDAQKIEEVLYNLFSNAFKHTSAGHQINISVESEINQVIDLDPNTKYIYISVFNEGDEIADSEKEKIFERFYKTNEKEDGAGIGLSFAKSLVEMHNGKIWFQNIKTRGVAFWVALPLIVADTLEEDIINENFLNNESLLPDQKTNPSSWEESEDENEKRTKILIVEDNTDLREYLVDILSRTYQCYEASDGEKALKITLSIIPDIIISDVIMPNLDGYGFVQKIKDDIKTCHIPVIMLTAKHSNDHIISGFESGVDAYLSKPFDTNVLLSQISRLIKNRELIHQKYKQQNFMVEISNHNLTRDDLFLNKVKKLLEKNIANPNFNVSELSEEMQMSTTQLYRKIKSLTNYSPVEFMRITRLHRAHDLLAQKSYSIKEVCYQTGFNNFSYFVKCFREYFGVTPASYRDKGDVL